MRASVILPAYNAGAHLAQCLGALVSQRLEEGDFDIVLVDNNSTDDTVAIARNFPRVRVLREEKQGSYAARNRGVGETRGEIVVFLDPDCCPHPGWLEAALAGFAAPGNQILLGQRVYGSSPALQLLDKYEDEKIQWILRTGRTENVYGYTNNMAVRRSVFEKFGLFPERTRGGDTIFVQRVVQVLGIGCVSYVPDMRVDHLELRSLKDYYRKRTIYGASNERISQEIAFRSLSSGQRFSVIGALRDRRRLALWHLLILLGLLVPGAYLYDRARRGAR